MKFSLALVALVALAAVAHAVPFVVPPAPQRSALFNNALRADRVHDVFSVVESDDEIAASMEPMITPAFQVFIREIGEGNYTPEEKKPEPESEPESVPELEENDQMPVPSAEAELEVSVREESDEMPVPSAEAELEVSVRESSVEMAEPMPSVEFEMDVAMREDVESDEPIFSAEPLEAMSEEPPVRFPNNQRPFPV